MDRRLGRCDERGQHRRRNHGDLLERREELELPFLRLRCFRLSGGRLGRPRALVEAVDADKQTGAAAFDLDRDIGGRGELIVRVEPA